MKKRKKLFEDSDSEEDDYNETANENDQDRRDNEC